MFFGISFEYSESRSKKKTINAMSAAHHFDLLQDSRPLSCSIMVCTWFNPVISVIEQNHQPMMPFLSSMVNDRGIL